MKEELPCGRIDFVDSVCSAFRLQSVKSSRRGVRGRQHSGHIEFLAEEFITGISYVRYIVVWCFGAVALEIYFHRTPEIESSFCMWFIIQIITN